MKNGQIEIKDAEVLRSIYKKFDIYGNTKEPLTVGEMVLILSLSTWIRGNID